MSSRTIFFEPSTTPGSSPRTRNSKSVRFYYLFPLLPPPLLPQSLLTLGSHTHPGPENTTALEKYYSLLLRVTRIISAAVLARGPQSNVTQGPARRFLTDYRMLIVQVLKRSAGIGGGGIGGGGNSGSTSKLERDIEDLTTAFMVLIDATGFLQVSKLGSLSNEWRPPPPPPPPFFFLSLLFFLLFGCGSYMNNSLLTILVWSLHLFSLRRT